MLHTLKTKLFTVIKMLKKSDFVNYCHDKFEHFGIKEYLTYKMVLGFNVTLISY